jgi:hypothetical protein
MCKWILEFKIRSDTKPEIKRGKIKIYRKVKGTQSTVVSIWL